MENRNYILDRLKSKTITIDEFNYDALQAPPILYFFNPTDIGDLHTIATSIRYSAKPHIRFQEIDRIMRMRGFVKFVSGTNRIAYRFPEDNSILAKVAIDNIGLGDNPRDFQNQFLFKPFVTKIFETTPCGTLALVERCQPITSREEFLSVASDIYEVLNNWFIGEYVLEDVGTNYFMNWSIRKGFGPVLHDFPYAYKLDGNKLFCNAPSILNPSGCCEGVIDYDPGFNYLHCTKCGVKYRAKELEAAIKQNNVIIKSQGGFKMKISIKGGTKDVNKVITTGQYSEMAKAIPQPKKNNKVTTEEIKKPATEENKNVVTKEKVVDKKSEPKKVVSNPISFDNSIKEREGETKIDKFNRLLQDALDIFVTSTGDDKKQMNDAIVEAFKDQIMEALDLNKDVTEDKSESSINDIIDNIVKDKNHDAISYFLNSVIEDDKYDMDISIENNYIDNNYFVIEMIPSVVKHHEEEIWENVAVRKESLEIYINLDVIIEQLTNNGYNIVKNNDPAYYEDIKHYAAKTINVTDIFENLEPENIIAIVDEKGNYLTVDNNVVAIDTIDDKSVDSVAIVSKQWRDSVSAEREIMDSDIPTGVLPPDMSINGVPVDNE